MYPGPIFSPSSEIDTSLNNLKGGALRAFYKLKVHLGHLFRQDLITTFQYAPYFFMRLILGPV